MNIDKSIKKMLGTTKKFGGKNDWDGDGVPNKRDCQPRNTMRQDKIPQFIPKSGALQYWKRTFPKANIQLVYMTPLKFMTIVKSVDDGLVDIESFNNVRNRMLKNLPIDPPYIHYYIEPNKTYIGFIDGSHRAKAAHSLDIKQIPVIIIKSKFGT